MRNTTELRSQLRRLQKIRTVMLQDLNEHRDETVDLSHEVQQLDASIRDLNIRIWKAEGRVKRVAGEPTYVQCPHCKRWYWARKGEILPDSN